MLFQSRSLARAFSLAPSSCFEQICHSIYSMKHPEACNLLQVCFFLGLFFEPEDAGDMFFRNVVLIFNGIDSITSQTIELIFFNFTLWITYPSPSLSSS
jgi:hypothetical protein